jgi:hypothetical protein
LPINPTLLETVMVLLNVLVLFTVSVPVTVALPPNVGLKADSFRVPFVVPSTAMKSSEAVLEAVVVRSLMRMSAILGEGYEGIGGAIYQTISA